MNKKKIVVAMSGGVDSSTAACVLVSQGYEVIGVSMRLPNSGEVSEGCCGVQGIDDARNVCQKLGIPFYALNYKKEFEDKVIDHFCEEYKKGRTPNPCIICNKKIKLGSLFKKAKSLGAEYLATGHYARIEYDKSRKRCLLKKGKDKEKDQSYFLFSLSQEQLARSVFPLGNYTKKKVRELAKEFGLKVHDKPASQEICFIPDNDYRRFLLERNPGIEKPGAIINSKGEILGKHRGIAFYTIGQRTGLGISHRKPLYVLAINEKKNTITVGEEKETYNNELTATDVNWVAMDRINGQIKVKAKIRYRHKPGEAVVSKLDEKRVRVKFLQPQRSITPGQSVVFYDKDTVIGGGTIE